MLPVPMLDMGDNGLLSKRYQLVTVSELMHYSGKNLDAARFIIAVKNIVNSFVFSSCPLQIKLYTQRVVIKTFFKIILYTNMVVLP